MNWLPNITGSAANISGFYITPVSENSRHNDNPPFFFKIRTFFECKMQVS